MRTTTRECIVSAKTMHRRVAGAVSIDCKPGPSTVLTAKEEQRLVQYVIEMSGLVFGLLDRM